MGRADDERQKLIEEIERCKRVLSHALDKLTLDRLQEYLKKLEASLSKCHSNDD